MQTFTGIVVSNKTPQTVAVELSYFKKHPKYQKILKLTTKLLAHNEIEGVNQGDVVKIMKSKPYSKLKHFKVIEVVSKKAVEEVVAIPKKEIKKEEKVKPVETKKPVSKPVKKVTKAKK